MRADKIQVDSDMTPLLCHVRVFSGKIVSVDKRGCPYGQPKCSEDSYLVVRDDLWLSWTTGQPLLRTLHDVFQWDWHLGWRDHVYGGY